MKSIITIHLNEIGKKAFNADKKIIYSDIPVEDITNQNVYDLFPKELIAVYTVEKSFLDLQIGDEVIVVSPDNVRTLGTVSSKYGKTINVYVNDNRGFAPYIFVFNANGLQATHCKQKYRLDWGTKEELDKFRTLKEKKPFITLLNVLTKDSGNAVQIDEANLVIPEWLTPKLIDELMNTIKCHREEDDYDNYDN